jgi:WD40-like Beta Propeller Repeat
MTRSLAVAGFVTVFLSGCMAVTPVASPSVAVPDSLAPSGLATPSASPIPTQVADLVLPGHVLYDRTTGADVHSIYLLTAGSEKRLTEPGEYQLGRISPDHRHILVLPAGEQPSPITGGTLDIEGQHFTPLPRKDRTLNLLPAAWSPDGTHIAFLAWDDADASRRGIYSALASNGGDLVRITTRPGPLDDVPLDYSPDGKWLVFYRSAHPDPDPHIGGTLWTVRIDGTGARQINGTAKPADWARWSPDGRRIVFANERLSPSGALWTVAPDGSDLRQVYTDPTGGFPISPCWSPDGSRILFALDPTNDEFKHADNFFVAIDADGTHGERVAGTTGFSRWPEWWR